MLLEDDILEARSEPALIKSLFNLSATPFLLVINVLFILKVIGFPVYRL